MKHVIVGDDDIDILDKRWVQSSVAIRNQWDKDVVVVCGFDIPEEVRHKVDIEKLLGKDKIIGVPDMFFK